MRLLRGVWVPCWRDVARLAAAKSGQCELGSFPACCVGSARQRDIANGRGKGGMLNVSGHSPHTCNSVFCLHWSTESVRFLAKRWQVGCIRQPVGPCQFFAFTLYSYHLDGRNLSNITEWESPAWRTEPEYNLHNTAASGQKPAGILRECWGRNK